MRVLVVGSGGREHALAWKLSQSSRVKKVYWTCPERSGGGNDSIEIISISPGAYDELLQFAQRQSIDMTVVGPDQALADGIVNLFEGAGQRIYGPTREAAQIESSKAFAKKIMYQAEIPTALYREFSSLSEVNDYLSREPERPLVVKKDGLALGKGVVICPDKKLVQTTAQQFLERENCGKIIVEEFLSGKELSFFTICDGNKFFTLGYACDYKKIRDDDRGPNTGGMGAYALPHWVEDALVEEIEQNIIQKLLDEMASQGTPFKGTLFSGLIKTEEGIKVLEFNARFGDPETQALLPLVDEDLAQILYEASDEKLSLGRNRRIQLQNQASVHVVMAAQGYPGTEGIPVRKGDPITLAPPGENEHIFFAGAKEGPNGPITNGGRVLGVTALAPKIEKARQKAYALVKKIHFQGMQFRKDIAKL